mgnify:CR=1 FL=1
MSTQILDTVLLFSLPASGKSETRTYMASLTPEQCVQEMAMGPTVQLDDYPYVQPNTAAIDLMDDDFKDNPAENVPAEVFESGHRTESLSSDVLKIYNDIWTDLKS